MVAFTLGLPDGDVRCIAADHLGTPVVGTKSGLFLCRGKEFLRIASEEETGAITCAQPDPHRELTWIGTDTGLFVLKDGRLRRAENDGLPRVAITALDLHSLGYLWVGTPASLLRMNDDGLQVIAREDDKRECDVRCIAETNHGGIVVLTSANDMYVNTDDVPKVSPMRWLPCTTVFFDRDGHRWMGLRDQKRLRMAYSNLRKYASWSRRIVKHPTEDAIWFVTNRGAELKVLARLQGNSITRFRIPFTPTVMHWHSNQLHMGTQNGLFRLDGKEVIPVPIKELQSGRIHDLVTDESNVLWVATSDGLVQVKNDAVHRSDPSPAETPIQHILVRGDEHVLATNDRVFYHRNGQLIRELDFSQIEESLEILDLLQTKDGEIWIGSTRGLFRQSNPEAGPVRVGPDNLTMGMFLVEGSRNEIWAGSRVGLWRIDRATEVMQVMTSEDGVGQKRIYSCLVDGDQTWLGSGDGLFRYEHRSTPPHLVIDQIATNRELSFDQVDMTTDDHRLTLDFHAVTPAARNGSTVYRYRLAGHEDWKTTTESQLEFQNLPTGSYKLELRHSIDTWCRLSY